MANLPETLPPNARVHVVGAGPVGLLMTALLQSIPGFSVRLYEKRRQYTRTRMVRLASYLAADSVTNYRACQFDAHDVEAVCDPQELDEELAYRRSIPPDLMHLLERWTVGFCPLNVIEHSLSGLIDARGSNAVERIEVALTAEDAMAMFEPGDVLIDCTGSRSVFRDGLVPGSGKADGADNTFLIRFEYALVITFIYGQTYDCNEYCKYFKNVENAHHKFIPMVHRTCYDGSTSHVTGVINITAAEYEAMPQRPFDGEWLRSHFPGVAQSMDRFIDKIKQETHGEILGDLEILRIPLNLYRARNATSRRWRAARPATEHPFASTPVFLAGDSAIGSPYFQSISLGFECAMFLAGLMARRDLPLDDVLDRYEMYIYKQWLRVYMQSKLIKHNKDLFECVDDPLALLNQLHIY